MGYINSLGALPALLIVCFLVVLAILWFLLPFAIFGIYSKMKELLRESKRTNELLAQQARSAPAQIDRGTNPYGAPPRL